MKMLMIVVESSCREELEVLLNKNEILGYSEISQAHGVGKTGPRLGSRAFPKTSSVFFCVVAADKVDQVVKDVRAYCDHCGRDMKIIIWGVEQVA